MDAATLASKQQGCQVASHLPLYSVPLLLREIFPGYLFKVPRVLVSLLVLLYNLVGSMLNCLWLVVWILSGSSVIPIERDWRLISKT